MAEEFEKLIKTPGLQHLASHVGFDRALVAGRIKETYEQTGRPSYSPTRHMIPVIMRVERDDGWVQRQIDLMATDSKVWKEAVVACGLLLDYRRRRQPAWFRPVKSRLFQLPTGLIVPVNPSGLLRADGEVRLLWPQLWKNKRLDDVQLAFHYEVLRRTFLILELENAQLDFVDLGRPKGEPERVLHIKQRDEMPTLSEEDFRHLCKIFHEEFDRFMRESGRPRPGAPETVPMRVVSLSEETDPRLI